MGEVDIARAHERACASQPLARLGPAEAARAPLGAPSLAWDRKHRTLEPGEVLYHQGSPLERAYLVRSGLVKLLSHMSGGRVRIVRLHTRDDWLGLEGLLGGPHEHTAVAIDPVELEHCSIAGLQRLRGEEPRLVSHLMRQWHQDLMQADRWIAEFSTGAITVRVARLVEYLATLDRGAPEGHLELLRVQEMADILGVTPESVSRILAGFKRGEVLRRVAPSDRERYRLDADKLQEQVDATEEGG